MSSYLHYVAKGEKVTSLAAMEKGEKMEERFQFGLLEWATQSLML